MVAGRTNVRHVDGPASVHGREPEEDHRDHFEGQTEPAGLSDVGGPRFDSSVDEETGFAATGCGCQRWTGDSIASLLQTRALAGRNRTTLGAAN